MEVYIKVHKVRIKITTNYEPYFRYLRLHFNKVILPGGNSDFDISICADWVTQPLKLASSAEVDRIAANTLMGKGKVATIRKIKKRKKVKMEFELQDKKLFLRAESRFKAFKDTLRYKIFNQPQESYFFELTYALVYYPLFWYAQYFLNAHPLHASSIKLKDKAVVLYGMEGVGKTTFSLLLSNKIKGTFMCDNIIFFDREKVYPCYEPLRLHRDGNTYLWEKKFRRINKFRTIKDFYEPVFDIEAEGINPAALIFLR
ncbi:MAG: hypothetical protein GF375_02670, partial [Candidatus Omnitrophica bacterium]|nr:hypothetical protein [Candidatus Omnitrophota bacterium]MBD3269001.1 hypothetical protein [Candidatus Omnitrophota bacterium]